MLEYLLIGLLGFLISAFGTVTGFGGGVIMAPLLIMVFHIPITHAIGAISVALFPSALTSTYFKQKKNLVDFKAGLLLEGPTMLGAFLGAMLTAWLPVDKLEILFASFVLLSGIMMIRKKKDENSRLTHLLEKINRIPPAFERKTEYGTYHFSGILTTILGLIAGGVAGMFGVGGGFIKGPIMIGAFKIPARIAAATALFMIVITSTVSSITHYYLGHVFFDITAVVTLSFFLGSLFGNLFLHIHSDQTLKKVIGIALLIASAMLFINTL